MKISLTIKKCLGETLKLTFDWAIGCRCGHRTFNFRNSTIGLCRRPSWTSYFRHLAIGRGQISGTQPSYTAKPGISGTWREPEIAGLVAVARSNITTYEICRHINSEILRFDLSAELVIALCIQYGSRWFDPLPRPEGKYFLFFTLHKNRALCCFLFFYIKSIVQIHKGRGFDFLSGQSVS